MKRRAKYLSRNDGSASVEFAFVGPVLFLTIFGIIEMGRAYFIQSSLQHAVAEVGRYAMVHTSASNTTISQQTAQYLSAINPSSVTVSIVNQTINSKSYMQIDLSYNYSSAVGSLLNFDAIVLRAQTIVPILP